MGLAITVAPLTAAVLSAISSSQAGIGSAINNAVARVAGLIAIAMTGTIIGETLDVAGFQRAMGVVALLMFAGGVVSWAGIRTPRTKTDAAAPDALTPPVDPVSS